MFWCDFLNTDLMVEICQKYNNILPTDLCGNKGHTRKWNWIWSPLSIFMRLACIYWYTAVLICGSREILLHRNTMYMKDGIKHEISFINREVFFAFYCIGRILLSDLHIKDPDFLYNKKGTCFNFKEAQIMKQTLW